MDDLKIEHPEDDKLTEDDQVINRLRGYIQQWYDIQVEKMDKDLDEKEQEER